ncbi:MFS transporter [Calidifontibacter terrae]
MTSSSTEPEFSLRRLALPAYGPSLLFGLGEGAALPVIVLTARHLGSSVPEAALIVMLIDVASLFCNVPASIVTARFGERWSIVGAAATAAVSALVCWAATELWMLVVGVLLMGASASVFMLARQSYLTEAVPAAFRARALSTLGGVMRIGVFIGPFLGAAAIGLGGLRSSYLVYLGAVAAAGAIAATLPDLPATDKVRAAGPVSVRRVLVEHRRTFLTVGIGILLVAAVRSSRQAVIPLWAEHLGLSPQAASLVYGIAGGVDMLVFYPSGKVMDLYGRRWVTVPSMLVMAASLIAMPFTHSVIPFAIVACVLGFGNGIGAGMVMTLGADYSPDVGRAQFLGIWRELSDLGAVGGPGLLSAVTAAVSLGPAIATTGVVGLGAAAVLYRSVPRKNRPFKSARVSAG